MRKFLLLLVMLTMPLSPEQRMEQAERSIRDSDVEHIIIFDQAGNILSRADGDPAAVWQGVTIPDGDWRGDVLTYNHPFNDYMAPADVQYAGELGVHQFRVVLLNHTLCTLTETPGHPLGYFEWQPWQIGPHNNYNVLWQNIAPEYGWLYACRVVA